MKYLLLDAASGWSMMDRVLVQNRCYFMVSLLFLLFCISVSTKTVSKDVPVEHRFSSSKKVLNNKTQQSVSAVKPVKSVRRSYNRITASTGDIKKEDYPPPPVDKSQLPEVIQSHLQAFADLCKLSAWNQQMPQLEAALNGLRKTIPFYLKYYFKQIDSLLLNDMYGHLFGSHMSFMWNHLSLEYRTTHLVDEFLKERVIMYNLSDGSGPEQFSHDWEHKVYRGLYCSSKGDLPKLDSESKE